MHTDRYISTITLMRKLGERIYADYFAGTWLNEYKGFIEASLQSSFEHWTIAGLNHTIAAALSFRREVSMYRAIMRKL